VLAFQSKMVPMQGRIYAADQAGRASGLQSRFAFGSSGSAALLAALDRARSGRMTDIVSTIQAEQDEIIRSPLSGVLVVQGGPGTGKTAVALHRAAYLLYTHRFPLERQGVLVVGPNPLFLRYIEQVLPSLGETGVTLSTIAGLVPEIRIKENGPADVARLKGDVRMAKVVARAVRVAALAGADDPQNASGRGGRLRPATRCRHRSQRFTNSLQIEGFGVHCVPIGDGTKLNNIDTVWWKLRLNHFRHHKWEIRKIILQLFLISRYRSHYK